ncbi:hypothetical protein Droror1_Dr00011208 [Drosera rotundifolia]
MDMCSKYFYALIKARRRKSMISCLVREDDTRAMAIQDISSEIVHYYQSLLGTTSPGVHSIDSMILKKGAMLTDAHKSLLDAQFSSSEVFTALSCIEDDKAPSPDGYTSKFFKCM